MDNLWQSHVGRGWTILASHTQWDDGLPLAVTCSEMDNLCRSHAVRWTTFASHMQWEGQPLAVTCSERDNHCQSHAVRWTTFAGHMQWDGQPLPVTCSERDNLCQSSAVRRWIIFAISHMQWEDGQSLPFTYILDCQPLPVAWEDGQPLPVTCSEKINNLYQSYAVKRWTAFGLQLTTER